MKGECLLIDYDTINLLGLQPDQIQTLNITRINNTININITLNKTSYVCPHCGSIKIVVKGYYNRKITHSIFNTNSCIINYRCRRLKCNDCYITFIEDNPFSASRQRISNATIIQVLKDCKKINYTFASIAEKNNLSPSSVVNIFDQYVDISSGRLPYVLSIDEFYLGKTWKNKFACVFIDWQKKKIIDIYPSRKKHKLHSYMQYIPKYQFNHVRFVSIDMNPTYRDFAHHFFKNCIVMVDSFHVIKNINEALKNLRIHIMYKQEKDSVEYYLLKHWNYLLMKRNGDIEDNEAKYNRKIGYSLNKPQILELILDIDPVLKTAYLWKEDYLNFNEDCSFDNAQKKYDELYKQLTNMNINEFKDVVSLLKNWREEIINSFITIDNRRISNGPIESINGRIKILLKNSLKYKNFQRLRNRIMYCINKDSRPLISSQRKSNKVPGEKRGQYKKHK